MLPAGWRPSVAAQMDAPARQAALHSGAQPQNQRRCCITITQACAQPQQCSPPLATRARSAQISSWISSWITSGCQHGHCDSKAGLEGLRAVCEQGLPPALPLQVLPSGVKGGASGGSEADGVHRSQCTAAGELPLLK